MINVQFEDSSKTKIIAYFAAPQNPDVLPNIGTVEASDERWAAFYYAVPEPARWGLPAPTAGE